MRTLATTALVALAAATTASCGRSDSASTGPTRTARATPSPQQIAAERRDREIDDVNSELGRASRERDRAAVALAERRLDALARTPAEQAAMRRPSEDAFNRALDTFRFKQAPLYAQQLVSEADDHRALAAVFREHFCLKAPDARSAAAQAVYGSLERRMRAAGITDFEFVVIPLTSTADLTTIRPLAIGRHGRLRLTRRGRSC